MALEVHTAELKAVDKMSQTFRDIGRVAGDTAKGIGRDFDNAGQATRRFNVDRAALVGGMRELQGIATEYARASMEETAQQDRLAQAVENTGQSYDRIAGRMQTLIQRGMQLSFADDQVTEALIKLTNTTGNADTAMADLGLAMDLARAKHIDLNTAAEIVGKVASGNIGILARYGIVLADGATAAEALAAMQAKFSGQAQIYSESDIGRIERYQNALDNLLESLFGQNQALGTFLALMPGVNAAYSTLAAIVAGMGGFGALAALAGPAALVAGGAALAYGYGSDQFGATTTNTLANQGFLYGSKAMNALLPGNPYDTQKYIEQMRLNDVNSVIDQMLIAPGEKRDVAYDRIKMLTGTITGEMSNNELAKYVEEAARTAGLTVGAYLMQQSQAAGFVRDPLSGTYMPASEYQNYAAARYYQTTGANYTSGATTMAYGTLAAGVKPGFDAGPYSGKRGMHVDYLAESYGSMAAMGTASYMATPGFDAAKLEEYRKQLRAMYGDYAGVVEGINSASDATKAFKAAQDSLLASEQPYSQQIGEYNSQLNAQEAAYKILQERQQTGVALTKQQLDFMNNYAEATARGTAGVEDATIAQGMLAQQYLLNMEKGDQLNQMLAGSTAETGNLVDAIYALIMAMDGVPPEVKTQITVNRAEEARAALQAILDNLNALDGRTATFYINAGGTGVSVGNPNGPGITPLLDAHGGLISAAAHGRMATSRYVVVGDGNGPEMVSLPYGSMVTPAGATRANRGRGSDGIVIHNLTVIANDAMEFTDSMRSLRYAEGRF